MSSLDTGPELDRSTPLPATNSLRTPKDASLVPATTVAEKTKDRANNTRFAAGQVSKHNTLQSLWIIIDGIVFDVTAFQHEHPGGDKVFAGVAGKDATKQFDKYHRRGILGQAKHEALVIGKLGDGIEDNTTTETGKKGWKRSLGRWLR